MKTLFPIALMLLVFAAAAPAEDAPAVIVYVVDAETGQTDTMQVWLTASSTLNLEYKTAPQSLNRQRKPRAEVESIYFYEPPTFKEALQLYEGRDYAGAKEKFSACKEAYKEIDELPGNYSTLGGFYELECARKMLDLETLKQLRDAYQFGALTRENHRNQLEVYDVWEAVRTKSWSRLDSLVTRMLGEKKWTGEHLAQLKYCHGLALEGLDRPTDALIAFNGAFTADYTASEVITKDAVLGCLRILKDHEEVKLAISLWGTEDEDKNSTGYLMLQEAVSLCDLWKEVLGGGRALPAEYTMFLKYRGKGGLFEGNQKNSAEEGKGEKTDEKPAEREEDDKPDEQEKEKGDAE